MGLLERIKSALGLGTSTSSPSSPSSAPDRQTNDERGDTSPAPVSGGEGDEQAEDTQPAVDPGDDGHDAESDDVDVTVEHEPDADFGDAVEGADTAGTGTPADDTQAGTGVDLEEIKGIGPAYADRLHEAGIEDVAALAAADPGELADRTDLGEGRLQKWVDRAGAR